MRFKRLSDSERVCIPFLAGADRLSGAGAGDALRGLWSLDILLLPARVPHPGRCALPVAQHSSDNTYHSPSCCRPSQGVRLAWTVPLASWFESLDQARARDYTCYSACTETISRALLTGAPRCWWTAPPSDLAFEVGLEVFTPHMTLHVLAALCLQALTGAPRCWWTAPPSAPMRCSARRASSARRRPRSAPRGLSQRWRSRSLGSRRVRPGLCPSPLPPLQQLPPDDGTQRDGRRAGRRRRSKAVAALFASGTTGH